MPTCFFTNQRTTGYRQVRFFRATGDVQLVGLLQGDHAGVEQAGEMFAEAKFFANVQMRALGTGL
jgi:hypothetical protein